MQSLPKRTQALLALFCALASILVSGRPLPVVKASESSGALDAGFGAAGKVTTDFAGPFDQAISIALQPNGRIVAAGATWSGTNYDFALARYTRDGALDTSFGVGGKVTTDFAGSNDQALSVALQPNGKIVVAGFAFISGAGNNFALARYNSDGALDASFGVGGKVTTSFAGSIDQAFSVAVQPNGKIVAAGSALSDSGYDFALARYNSDGALDANFGVGGKVITDFASPFDRARSVAVLPNGKIVAAGHLLVSGINFDFAMARYTSDGSLDTSFGDGGKVNTDFAGYLDQAFSVALQPNGKIVVAGTAVAGVTGNNFALARYTSDGALDASFGVAGKVITDFAGADDVVFSVAARPDGKIVAAGMSWDINIGYNFALARYTSDGALDAGFGVAGKVITDFAGADDGARSVVLQPDGKIVVAGYAVINRAQDFALARYE